MAEISILEGNLFPMAGISILEGKLLIYPC